MVKQIREHYAYFFEPKDRQAVKQWLKENKLKLKDINKKLGFNYDHLVKVVNGKRPAFSKTINTLRKWGIKLWGVINNG